MRRKCRIIRLCSPKPALSRTELLMAQNKGIEQIVAQAVSQALESQLPQLRDELVRRVTGQVLPQLKASDDDPGDGFQHLLKAVCAVHSAVTQRDILRTLLDNAVQHCGRVALFVVKGSSVNGWQARAFTENDALKDFALDGSSGLVARVLGGHTALSGKSKEMDHKFISRFGSAWDDHCLLLPLMLRDKVAALLYADAGLDDGGHVDHAALELLVIATGTWLEVVSQRKAMPRDGSPEGAAERTDGGVAKASAAAATPALNDPFASHTPAYAKAAAAGSSSTTSEHSFEGRQAGAPSEVPNAFAGMSPEEADSHRKAQRFARLLVDEIKLYNQAKLIEGRKHKDVYDRLQEDIDKSRASYQKRYGSTSAASGDYFNNEVIRSLAEDDVSLLGPNFKR
jgi:hypothetical protein